MIRATAAEDFVLTEKRYTSDSDSDSRRHEEDPDRGRRSSGVDREKFTTLRFRAVTSLAAALEAELLSLRSDFMPSEEWLEEQPKVDFYEAVDTFERNLLIAALTLEKGSQTRAAQRLSLSTSTFHTMAKRYGIDARTYKTIEIVDRSAVS